MDTNEDQPMDTEVNPVDSTPHSEPMPSTSQAQFMQQTDEADSALTELDQDMRAIVATIPQARDPFRDIPVKVHIRRPERDNWTYLGRGIVSQEVQPGQSVRLVVRSVSSHKVLISFGEDVPLQAEKRGNFVVVATVVEGNRVISWSLNAQNNSETLRLLASIDLACHSRKPFVTDSQSLHRRRVARMIKDDRKRRHKRRKDQDAMVAAFARTGIESGPPEQLAVGEPAATQPQT
ncbi:uncharacterized protein FIBRA_07413 [Fibroporia radiculosa]|uniref:Uncharacterized protein n=1 Tax=Fibroporia radiculosa TaxID=599839 RepID=J4H4L6_9APHY|nr:uncharacterized protein FIBRA_07413 [Fibroporia radiculosa]CCM05204.1 predicted protein [Fibroporia radiculosa]